MILHQCVKVILTIMKKKIAAIIVISAILLNVFAALELRRDEKWSSESNAYFQQIPVIEK